MNLRSVSALACASALPWWPTPIPAQGDLSQAYGLSQAQVSGNAFNPAISLILQGTYINLSQDREALEIPGFQLGGEAALPDEGLSLGESELNVSANIDDLFFGAFTLGLHSDEGELETEIEEAFIETIGLGQGLTLRAGRFFSELGYLNSFHQHAWDFFDAPLIYTALFGDQLIGDGLQARWVAPTDLFVQLGVEALRGDRFPAGGITDDVGAWTAFAHTGWDSGASHAFQLGLSYWSAHDIQDRAGGGHGHGLDEDTLDAAFPEAHGTEFSGDSRIVGIDFVYKWAPNGNLTEQNFKFQAEFFQRDEEGAITLEEEPPETTSIDSAQSGGYVQGVYQFIPHWRAGLRYDRLEVDNRGAEPAVLEEAGLAGEGHTPRRYSAMIDYSRSEFSRLRLQYNRDEVTRDPDHQIILQYIMSLGAHGSHRF